MRIRIATLLIRLATRIVEGHDDRIVILNTERKRSKVDGRVHAFYGQRRRDGQGRSALALPPGETMSMGTPVPVIVARLAGWTTYGPGEDPS